VFGFLQRPRKILRFPNPDASGSKPARLREGAKGWTKRLECGLGPAHQSHFTSPETLMTLLLHSAKLRINTMQLAHSSMVRYVMAAGVLHHSEWFVPSYMVKGRLS
jgi:hypothetical protein